MMPGSSRPNSLQSDGIPTIATTKRRILPSKRSVTMPGLTSLSQSSSRNYTPKNRDIFSPRSCLSPTDVFSPRSCLSPTNVSSPRNCVSPTYAVSPRNCVSPTYALSPRNCLSPTYALSPRNCLSPNESDRYLSPTSSVSSRGDVLSPRLCLSPTSSISSGSNLLSPRSCLSPTNSAYYSRSPSPSSSCSLPSYSSSENPRRVFPQQFEGTGVSDIENRDQSPIVFDAGFSFVLGTKSKIHRRFKPTPAHMEPRTASSTLSGRIADFLKKSDHIMDEWRRLGHKDDEEEPARSKSARNIRIKGFALFSKEKSECRSLREAKKAEATISEDDISLDGDDDSDRTISEGNELSEMTADLADEHSTSILATERLEAETSERLRLERELQEMQVHQQSLTATSERLEMELLYLRAADGASEDDEDGAGGADAGVYKQRYERTLRELELTKHRLHQQHEDDLEQLVALKKQLEKKLGDAYEEVNEQRQVAGQWKRKVQKLTSETNDLRLLLEEQNSRNTLLEKKQRRFDGEFQSLQEQLRQEKQAKERASREREMALGEKYTLEQNLSATKLELELKEEHANSLSRELDELATGGHTDLEVAALKRAKHELDKKLTEQEEELDDLAGQLSLVSQAKLRMEMSLEQQRKESRREQAQRDEELEDVRCNAIKKVKALESQLESEHEERTQLLREKHDLERRLTAAQDAAGRSQRDTELTAKLKRDVKRTRALLKDANIQLQKTAMDAPSKALLRQLRNQLEDAELARASAVKSRQTAEAELSDLQAQLDECQRARSDAEEKAAAALRAGQDLRTQLDENEEELAEVLKKYRGSVAQLSAAQAAAQDAVTQCAVAEQERFTLREQLAELTARLECAETSGEAGGAMAQRRMELRAREVESRLELEQTTRARLEVQISRLKDSVEKLQADAALARTKEQTALVESRKLSRALREAREEVSAGVAKEADTAQRRKEAEGRLEAAQAETQAAKADLRLALTRINDLQAAIQDDCSQSESEHDSDSDESIESFLVNHDTKATWNESRLSLSRSPARRSPSSEHESSKSAEKLPKTIADTTTKESYA